jgi:hypothetical protein
MKFIKNMTDLFNMKFHLVIISKFIYFIYVDKVFFIFYYSIEEKVLVFDCHINCEDVTLGLALQCYTPFKYIARKVWCSYGFIESEYSFKNYDLISLLNPNVKNF